MKSLFLHWLTQGKKTNLLYPRDYQSLCQHIQPADVLLIQWNSRMGEMIAHLSKSPWTHAVLYIGRIVDIKDPILLQRIRTYYSGDEQEPLIIEGIIEKITQVTPLSQYQKQPIRICRAIQLTVAQQQHIINYAVSAIGYTITHRQIWNLIKLFCYWTILPHGLFNILFKSNRHLSPKIYASVIAEAFESARAPIMPMVMRQGSGDIRLTGQDIRTIMPKDFDESPYFEIIKYPLFGIDASHFYSQETI